MRSAAIACSVFVVGGFITALSRPSGIETLPAPAGSHSVAAPPAPSPPVRVAPSPAHHGTTPAAHPLAHPRTVSTHAHPSTPGHRTAPSKRHLRSRRSTHDFRDEMVRLYKQWRAHQRERLRYGPQGHRHATDHDDAPRGPFSFPYAR
jgi:hypothetical protein